VSVDDNKKIVELSAARASAQMSKLDEGSGRPASSALAKRFYKAAEAAPLEGGYTVQLDGKALRTPARKALLLPSEALAQAVAAEWGAQGELIDKSTMPLMALCCIALDVATDKAAEMRAELVEYAGTDQLCYREPEGVIREAQEAAYEPLLAWAKARYGAQLDVTHGIYPIPQDPAALGAFARALKDLDAWQLAAASVACGITRSLVQTLALIEGEINAEEAHRISALEEVLQAEQWGMDDEQQKRLDAWKRDLDAVELLLQHIQN
jgi:chaperone required for assembly of F1-ATPase